MTAAGVISDEQYKQMDQQCKQTAAGAVEFAESSQAPAIETLYEDVFK